MSMSEASYDSDKTPNSEEDWTQCVICASEDWGKDLTKCTICFCRVCDLCSTADPRGETYCCDEFCTNELIIKLKDWAASRSSEFK